MIFYLNELEIVIIIGAVLIIVYFIGSYWKHRKLTKYAHIFEEKLNNKAKVQFKSYGHAGLGIRLEMKDRTIGFREVYLALSMGARENLMHYPLLALTKGYDRISFWGILEKPLRINIRIMDARKKSYIKQAEEKANLRRVTSEELDRIGYVAYSSNSELARPFLGKIVSALRELRDVELIETDMTSSLIKIVSRLKEEAVFDLLNFLFYLGRTL
jgi:hypothetical protein